MENSVEIGISLGELKGMIFTIVCFNEEIPARGKEKCMHSKKSFQKIRRKSGSAPRTARLHVIGPKL